MKKIIAVMAGLVMVMAFTLAACGGSGGEDLSDSKYVGTWVAKSVSVADESGDLDGGVWSLTLNGDGTGAMTATAEDGTEEVSNITWQLTDGGFKTKGDTKLNFTDDGDGIKASVIGIELHFVREGEGEAEGGEDVVDLVDGKAYGYGGDDPVEAACYEYLVETVAKNYEASDVSIPVVKIVNVDYKGDEVLVAGDFWIYNYNINGDVLETASGGNCPGIMHVSKDDYTVTSFDVVADGGEWEDSAKELFGENYDSFMEYYSNEEAREEDRKITVSDYVNFNGLDVNYYQDYGWDPVELYHAGE